MFQKTRNSFILLILWIGLASAQSAPPSPPTEPEKGPETPALLPPLPYPMGQELRYRWIHEGVDYATTTVRIEAVKDEDGAPRLRVRGRLDYDRAGRVISGTSDATYAGDIAHPVAYRRSLLIDAPGLGGADATLVLAISGSKVDLTRRDSQPQLTRRELTIPEPIWLLDDQCFEHWVLLAPYLPSIVHGGELAVFVPHGEVVDRYTIGKELTEGEGASRRDRWSIRRPALDAKLWTDARGRLVEYLQGEVRIVLEESPRDGAPPAGPSTPPSPPVPVPAPSGEGRAPDPAPGG